MIYVDLHYLIKKGLVDFVEGDVFTLCAPMEKEEDLFDYCRANNLKVMDVRDKFFEASVYAEVEVNG